MNEIGASTIPGLYPVAGRRRKIGRARRNGAMILKYSAHGRPDNWEPDYLGIVLSKKLNRRNFLIDSNGVDCERSNVHDGYLAVPAVRRFPDVQIWKSRVKKMLTDSRGVR